MRVTGCSTRERASALQARVRCASLVCLSCFLSLTAVAHAQVPPAAYKASVLAIQQRIEGNDLEGARTLLTSAMARFPSDGGLENLLGVIEVQEGHNAKAIDAFSRAVQHSPHLTGAYLNLGRLLMMSPGTSSSQGDALKVYRHVEQLDPTNGEARYEAATLLLQRHEYSASLNDLQHLSPDIRKQARVEALICADQFGVGNDQVAATTALALAGNPELTEQDAVVVLPSLRAAHRADLVESLFTAASHSQPLSPEGVRILGLAQEAQGNLIGARATLERAYAMNSDASAPLVDLTRIALAQKDNQGALGYLAHARAANPNNPDYAFEFGLVCLHMNLLGEALKAMGEALQLDPDRPEFNLEYGALTTLADDPARALPYLNKYHSLRPSDPQGDLVLGAAYFQHNEYDKAEPWLQAALTKPSTAGAAHYYLGSIQRRQGHTAEALKELLASAELRPDQADVHAELGQVYTELGKLPEAQAQLDRALALEPDNYAANLALVRLYSRTGDPRRDAQVKRFQLLREDKSAEYNQAMRVIEVRPMQGMQATP